MARIALTRPVSRAITRCALSFLERSPIDVDIARTQHQAYEESLEALGCSIRRLPVADALPDAVFIEDTAVVLDEVAVLTRPGAVSRRPEVEAVAEELSHWRRLARIESPGTLDGGDVLRVGKTLYVGRSARTNRAGIEALARIADPLDYRIVPVTVRGCLHLKSAASWIGGDRVLVNRARLDADAFEGLRVIPAPEAEAAAANVLVLDGTAMISAGFHRTWQLLEDAGLDCVTVDNSELAKAEGGLTCCSLIFDPSPDERHRAAVQP